MPPLRILLPKTPSSEDENTVEGTFAESNSTTVDVDTLVIAEADISSGSETQSPKLKTNEILVEVNVTSTKKIKNQAHSEDPSQQRLTRFYFFNLNV